MNAPFIRLSALFLAALTIAPAAATRSLGTIAFTVTAKDRSDQVQLTLDGSPDGESSTWSNSMAITELPGLGMRDLGGVEQTNIRFSLVRPAGRLDCTGAAARSAGAGSCTFSAEPSFAAMLDRRGIRQPTVDQAYLLTVSDFRPELLDALTSAGYRTLSADDLVKLAIFEIDSGFVTGLATAGYRVGTADDLVGFKIHRVTPELIAAYRSLGYDRLAASDLMAMAIHGVTPEFITSFVQLGYRGISADQLVQMRIFGVTPDYVRLLQDSGAARPTADQLVRLRIGSTSPDPQPRPALKHRSVSPMMYPL